MPNFKSEQVFGERQHPATKKKDQFREAIRIPLRYLPAYDGKSPAWGSFG
jgi:hypothetical protein